MAKKAASKVEDSETPGKGKKRLRKQIDIDRDLKHWIDFITADLPISSADWISNKIRPIVIAELAATVKRMNLELPNIDE